MEKQENTDPTTEQNRITIHAIADEVNQLAGEQIIEITGTDLILKKAEALKFLLEPILQKVGLACLAGSSDTGKSSILRQLAIAIVTGEATFLGFNLKPLHNSVIYVSTEDLESETAFLLKKQTEKYQPEQLQKLRFLFETQDIYNELDKRLTADPADLVIIDCLADAFAGDLKDTQKVRTFLHTYQQLAQKHQCLLLFLHHTGKRTENLVPSKNNLLSGQGLEAKMRLVIELRVDHINPTLRHFCIVKGNYLSSKYKRESFVLKFYETNFTFENTGDRVAFELLAKPESQEDLKSKFDQVEDLVKEGLNYEQIALQMGYGSKGTVSKILRKGREMGWGEKDDNPAEKTGSIAFPVSESLVHGNRKRTNGK